MAEKSTIENSSSGGGGGDAASAPYPLPRVTIRFCTQCKWMLRAAYFAQELLSTFSTSLGEVALQPSTGGTFVVELFFQEPPPPSSPTAPEPAGPIQQPRHRVLWDRKVDGGFPETKELKRRVRDAIEPGRSLGHVDRDHRRGGAEARPNEGADGGGKEAARKPTEAVATQACPPKAGGEACEDCQLDPRPNPIPSKWLTKQAAVPTVSHPTHSQPPSRHASQKRKARLRPAGISHPLVKPTTTPTLSTGPIVPTQLAAPYSE
ncbi:hypothetical protein DL762_009897 [Monosporascus cannonballus]|uniref:Selenoprotein W-like protein n=1 Tax=Monosporascus cannonballus TaxID=155416 RepID=A0ABY0GS57_9PEZI|nr:hypothetical protein DL762_009897 [Monosporascus cannonballus]